MMALRKQKPPVLPIKPSFLGHVSDHDVYQAIFDFTTDNPSVELSFVENELFEMLEKPNGGWFWGKSMKTNRTGYVPEMYVKKYEVDVATVATPKEYNIGALKRDEAEQRLKSCNDATFLIRTSENRPADFTLSVKDGNAIEHYPVVRADNGSYFITRKTMFKTINELVEYYSAGTHSDGLCVKLGQVYAERASLNTATNAFQPFVNKPNMAVVEPTVKLEVNINQLIFLEIAGKGKYCEVFKGKWKTRLVAIKKLTSHEMSQETFLAEAEVMKCLKHPNILELLAISTHTDSTCLVLEYCSEGSLQDYLKNNELQTYQLVSMAEQIAKGMAHLQLENCIHRNLATRNIMVYNRDTVKIADFGLAKLLGTKVQYLAEPGEPYPIKWTAPEAAEDSVFSIKSDVWSYGIVLIELWTKAELPYKGVKNADVLAKIKSGYRLQKPRNCPDQIYEIMMQCWCLDPVKRPDFMVIKMIMENMVNESDYL